jgi:hypothetical protein
MRAPQGEELGPRSCFNGGQYLKLVSLVVRRKRCCVNYRYYLAEIRMIQMRITTSAAALISTVTVTMGFHSFRRRRPPLGPS